MSEMLFKRHLAELLKQNQMTAAELSRKTGIARQVISDWLAGVHPRSLNQVKAIGDIFGVTVDEICFGTDSLHKEMRLTGDSSLSELLEVMLTEEYVPSGRYEVVVLKN